MNYNELIKDYHSKGFGTEKKMWESPSPQRLLIISGFCF